MTSLPYKYAELSHKIIGCAMHVHSTLGNGFQEVVYQRSLAIEFGIRGISFEREKEMTVYYKDQFVGARRVDFIVEDVISVELKALIKMDPVHLSQARSYLEAYNVETGLLINFGAKSLQFKRIYNDKFIL